MKPFSLHLVLDPPFFLTHILVVQDVGDDVPLDVDVHGPGVQRERAGEWGARVLVVAQGGRHGGLGVQGREGRNGALKKDCSKAKFHEKGEKQTIFRFIF